MYFVRNKAMSGFPTTQVMISFCCQIVESCPKGDVYGDSTYHNITSTGSSADTFLCLLLMGRKVLFYPWAVVADREEINSF